MCEEMGLKEQQASQKKVVCELHPGGERQPCGRMSQAAGAGQSPWSQQEGDLDHTGQRGGGVEREISDDSCRSQETCFILEARGSHESILSMEMT